MTTQISGRIPPHVPSALVLEEDPWQSGNRPPLEWMLNLAGGGGFRYSPHHPLLQDSNDGSWIAAGAKEIRAVLIDNRNFVSKDSTGVGKLLGEDLVLAPLESDAPDHQRLRGILQPYFQPNAVKAYAERIRTLSMELIKGVESKGRCEFIQEFASKLPTQIFVELVGLPVSDLPQLLEWEHIVMGRGGPEKIVETWSKVRAYLEAQIEQRMQAPRDDFLGRIVAQTATQGVNPDAEALGMAMILFAAGLDTVVTALGWHFKYLADHPEQQERLRRDPALIPAAVDEMLRAFSFTTLTRTAVRDVEVCGVTIKAGDKVNCPTVLGSRDPDDYLNPDIVDFDRGAMRHLAFGFGQHICIGMHLAKLELSIALECWLATIPPFRTSASYRPSWHGGSSFGLDSLELEW